MLNFRNRPFQPTDGDHLNWLSWSMPGARPRAERSDLDAVVALITPPADVVEGQPTAQLEIARMVFMFSGLAGLAGALAWLIF